MKRKRSERSSTPLIPTFSPQGEKEKNVSTCSQTRGEMGDITPSIRTGRKQRKKMNPSPGGRGDGVRAEKCMTTRARSLRKSSTKAENLLWYHFRNRRVGGFKFRRQFVIGHYIVDFVCPHAKLVVELDGGQHATRKRYDHRRTEYLKKKGYRVIRFWNNDVLLKTGSVLDEILVRLADSHPSSQPSPLEGRRRKI